MHLETCIVLFFRGNSGLGHDMLNKAKYSTKIALKMSKIYRVAFQLKLDNGMHYFYHLLREMFSIFLVDAKHFREMLKLIKPNTSSLSHVSSFNSKLFINPVLETFKKGV